MTNHQAPVSNKAIRETRYSKGDNARESQGMLCCVCLEIVSDKETKNERRFGILPNCNHCYCVECIRTWRRTKREDGTAVNTCPVCRRISYVFVPSPYWVANGAEKTRVIRRYMDFIGTIPCKHFNKGRGICYFGASCFYSHRQSVDDQPSTRLGPHVPGYNSACLDRYYWLYHY